MDNATFIRGFGVRFRIAPGTQIVTAPTVDGSLMSALVTSRGTSNGFIKVASAGQPPELLAGADGTTGGIELCGTAEASEHWEVESRGVACGWPALFKLVVRPPGPWTFELRPATSETGDKIIFLRGPLRGAAQTPTPADLIAPGQRLVADDMRSNAMWMELEYEHDGATWRQRHQYAVPAAETVVLVTSQAPRGQQEALFAAANAVTKSVRVL